MSTLKNISVSGRQTAKTKDSRHFGKNDRVLTSDLNSKRDGLWLNIEKVENFIPWRDEKLGIAILFYQSFPKLK